jgi:hypothetical protein
MNAHLTKLTLRQWHGGVGCSVCARPKLATLVECAHHCPRGGLLYRREREQHGLASEGRSELYLVERTWRE